MSGFLIQSRFGTKGNFEVVLPGEDSGLIYLSRDNDAVRLRWSDPERFGASVGQVSGTSLIQSSFGTPPGNLEVVAVATGQLFHFWRDAGGRWSDPGTPVTGNVGGTPALIESSGGTFDVVVPAADGGLVHVSRDNRASGLPWSAPTIFGTSLGRVAGASLIQSDLGKGPENLEVIATPESGGRFAHFTRSPAREWSNPVMVGGEVFHGGPGLIQGRLGTPGHFEAVVPNELALGIAHYWRDNGNAGSGWKYGVTFGGQTQFLATSLIESNYGEIGNLEVVAATMFWTKAFHFSRNDNSSGFPWSGPTPLF